MWLDGRSVQLSEWGSLLLLTECGSMLRDAKLHALLCTDKHQFLCHRPGKGICFFTASESDIVDFLSLSLNSDQIFAPSVVATLEHSKHRRSEAVGNTENQNTFIVTDTQKTYL